MKKVLFMLLSIFFMVVLVSGNVIAEDSKTGVFDEKNFSGKVYFTTDYVNRGLSFSDGDPALQSHLDYFNPIGVYLGIWGSSWDDGGYSNDIELGGYAGLSKSLGPINYDLMAARYIYPGAEDDGFEFDYWEFSLGLSYTIPGVPLDPTVGVSYLFSPNYSGDDGHYHYYSGSLDLTLPHDFVLSFGIGYCDLEGDKSTGNGWGINGGNGYEYMNYSAGISTTLKGFGLDLTYHATNKKDEFAAIGYDADNKLVFTLSRSF